MNHSTGISGNRTRWSGAGYPVLDDDAIARAHALARRYRAEAFHRLVVRPVARAWRRTLEAYRAYRVEADTVRALSALDDHLLKDIGLHRSEIRRVAAECAARRETTARPKPTRVTVATASYEAANDDDAGWREVDRLAG